MLAIATVLLGFAYHATNAPMEKMSDAVTGRYSTETMWYLAMGIASVVGGRLLAVFGSRKYRVARAQSNLERIMSLGTILIIVLLLMLVGVLPTWPHSKKWGYYPTSGLGIILVIVIVLFLLGRI